jgi:hypothetical protein
MPLAITRALLRITKSSTMTRLCMSRDMTISRSTEEPCVCS